MKIHIKYYGLVAEKTGTENEMLEVENKINSSVLHEMLKQKYGLFQTNHRLAVNRKIVSEQMEINENDELALLPPFAGG